MLKKLLPTLALTGLVFGSGLCFNPYNHDYVVSTEKIYDTYPSNYDKTLILHNGKMQVNKYTTIELVKYITDGNKALVLMRSKDPNKYFVVYTKCTHGKPVTIDLEKLGHPGLGIRVVDIPRYPTKFGFYKDGFWVKALHITLQHGWYHHPPRWYCNYKTTYYPYKLIKEHKIYDAPSKGQYFPFKVCYDLALKLGM